MKDEFIEPMDCKEVRQFLPFFVLGGKGMSLDEKAAMGEHLQFCRHCAKDCMETKAVIGLIQDNLDYLIESRIFSMPDPQAIANEPTTEESQLQLLEKLERTEARKTHNKRIRQAKKILMISSRIAACLVIGISVFLGLLFYIKPKIAPEPILQQIALSPKPPAKIELISENGSILIPTNRQIASTDELMTLVINGKHRIVMNTNTVLAIKPKVENGNAGCLVKLDSGQIYAHVEHDGDPFVVRTIHGQAVITGTTFDIIAIDDITTLVVSEGTVRFNSKKGVVDVTAGQQSQIVGRSAPSIPILCNTAELTAWATGYKPGPILAQTESNTDPWYPPLLLENKPIILEEIDYDHWVEQKRDWFKHEFPWIFDLKEALAKEGIEVDYPELLIGTGDVWQFVCLEVSPARFSVIDPNSLLKTASDYGFDKLWLLENVSSTEAAIGNPAVAKGGFTGLEAFEKLISCFEKVGGSIKEWDTSILLCSLHANMYLVNTRILIWLSTKNGMLFHNKNELEMLSMLEREISIANECRQIIIQQILIPQETSSTRCTDTTVEQIVTNLRIIYCIEESLLKQRKW